MLKKLLFIPTIMMMLHADNSIEISDTNKKLTISQKSKQLGTNSIHIGDNNKNITINQKIEVINLTNNTLNDIKIALKNLLPNRDNISNDFQKILNQSEAKQYRSIKKLHQKYKDIISKQNFAEDKVRYLQSDIDYLISQNDIQIQSLKKRISDLETDVSFLMQEFKKGNLDVLSFYMLHIDGLHIDDTFYKGAGVGYERLFNSSVLEDISLISNLSFLFGTEENIIEHEEKRLILFDVGVKKPFSSIENPFVTYGQSSLGYMGGDESSLYVKLGIGIEKYNKKNKISLSLNYLGIFEKEEKIIKTHLLGNAQVSEEKKYQNSISLVLSMSFTGL